MRARAQIIYERDVERNVVSAFLLGSRVTWITYPHGCAFDPDTVIRDGHDGDAHELGTWYGVPNAVRVRVLPPRRGQTGRFELTDCGILVDGSSEKMTWRFPRSDTDWSYVYLIVKSFVLDAAAHYVGDKHERRRPEDSRDRNHRGNHHRDSDRCGKRAARQQLRLIGKRRRK